MRRVLLGSLRHLLDREGRVMTVDLALEGQRTLRLGSVYSPTTGASSKERQAFYDEITRFSAGGEPRARISLTLNLKK